MDRIEETRTLYELLPAKSAASGKEFARIVNLLLFHDARRRDRLLTLFDDRAGDFHGLDAMERQGDQITVGYQHKFYPSPLSDKHRKEIEDGLKKTAWDLRKEGLTLKKWVLVTPQDSVESSRRKTGGDVTWFNGLKKTLGLSFALEHWGHTALQAQFIATPAIGLYYYPELFPDGAARRKTLQEQRTRYDRAMTSEHGRIEFVGMSVYKQEAARTVAMENIYIPLSLVPEGADVESHDAPRYNPQDLLTPGSQHVVLGDPGSGKTTLLRFLALLGRSKALQKRYGQREAGARFEFHDDERLPILITLRRYADALKQHENLSLLDYIREVTAADFSIADLSREFFEYHLESGRAILLFDGVDELPDSGFKKKIRDRIRHLAATHPGNTVIVTSRIYGYQGAFRFDEGHVRHHRLAPLNLAEIERFVEDWYAARVERAKDRKDYMESLLGILRNEDHEAIRALARNPLLLTIMVLVHRIDAVLPDERHVLYQKCTETLLNTWHTWKFHEMDRLHRAKVDRLNMQRMQAIAYWMQHRMGEAKADQQAVVSYQDLHRELSRHIAGEKPPNPDYAPEDLATAFIDFVQDRAGLLVEIGDQRFSFVHLTFQEYLTAGQIRLLTEPLSLDEAWQTEIGPHCGDPRWREALRLLVAGYGSDTSQERVIDHMLALKSDANVCLLLGGLLLDGISAAQMRMEEIFRRLLLVAGQASPLPELSALLDVLRANLGKFEAAPATLEAAARGVLKADTAPGWPTRLRLALIACGLPLAHVEGLVGRGADQEPARMAWLFTPKIDRRWNETLKADLDRLELRSDADMLTNPFGCLLKSIAWGLAQRAQPRPGGDVFTSLLATLVYGPTDGPLPFVTSYLTAFADQPELQIFGFSLVLPRDQNRARALTRARAWARARAPGAGGAWRPRHSTTGTGRSRSRTRCPAAATRAAPRTW